MTASFSLNKVDDELVDFGSPDHYKPARVYDSFFSNREGHFDNELCNAFKEDNHHGELRQDASSF